MCIVIKSYKGVPLLLGSTSQMLFKFYAVSPTVAFEESLSSADVIFDSLEINHFVSPRTGFFGTTIT